MKKITLYAMTKHFKSGDSLFVPDSPPQSPQVVPEHETVPEPQAVPEPETVPDPEVVLVPESVSQPQEEVLQRLLESLHRTSHSSKLVDRLKMSWGTKSYVQEITIKEN